MEPRYNADLGIYEWGDPEPVPAPIEPAFVKEAIERDFEPTPIYSGVTTFGQVYPSGTKGSISTAEPVEAEEFDALADWRVPGEVADEVLISLPDGTPRMLRTLLTLLLGAMRGGPGHSKPS